MVSRSSGASSSHFNVGRAPSVVGHGPWWGRIETDVHLAFCIRPLAARLVRPLDGPWFVPSLLQVLLGRFRGELVLRALGNIGAACLFQASGWAVFLG